MKNDDENRNVSNEIYEHNFNIQTKEKEPNANDFEFNSNLKLKNLSLNERLEKQRKCHEYIRQHEENFENDQGDFLNALSFILKNSKFKIKLINDFINLSFEYDFVKTLIKTLKKANAMTKSIEMDEFYIPYVITSMVRTFSNYSLSFCIAFQESNGILLLSNIIKSKTLLELKSLEIVLSLIRNCIGSLINFGRVNSNFMNEYRQANTVESLFVCSNQLGKTNNDIEIACFMALAFLVDDDEVTKFENDIKKVIPGIVGIVRKIAKNFKDKKSDYINIKRVRIQLKEGDIDESEVASTDLAGTMWHLVEVLNGLYHLAVVDSIKGTIYFENKMCEYLRTFISYGNSVEIEHSLTLLYQLCFDKTIAKNVIDDDSFFKRICNLQMSGENEDIKIMANSIVWLLGEKDEKKTELNFENFRFKSRIIDQSECESSFEGISQDARGPSKPQKKKEKKIERKSSSSNNKPADLNIKHIMISYNRESRDLCLKIKSELEKMNYKIWIDVENIHGSSLESMALAIENSMCVLMCMTEKYKQSPNCRAEAEYAFNLNKPIIPLIMQKEYQPNGWLGE
jgi:hypothetical protein